MLSAVHLGSPFVTICIRFHQLVSLSADMHLMWLNWLMEPGSFSRTVGVNNSPNIHQFPSFAYLFYWKLENAVAIMKCKLILHNKYIMVSARLYFLSHFFHTFVLLVAGKLRTHLEEMWLDDLYLSASVLFSFFCCNLWVAPLALAISRDCMMWFYLIAIWVAITSCHLWVVDWGYIWE